MYSKFKNLPEEKRNRIIDVCIEEFAKNGYDNASTNNIVKNADISKGILFHYFGNKKNLFFYIYDYIMDYFMDKVIKTLENDKADIFERIINIGIAKMEIYYQKPLMYKFLFNSIYTSNEIQKEVQLRMERAYQESVPLILKNLDTTNFRNDIDKNKAIEVIFFALEGISNKYMKLLKNKNADEIFEKLEDLNKEYYQYVDILKKGICSNI